MMRWIVSTSIRFRFLVVALGVGLMAFGFAQLRSMPVDVFPEFAPPKVEIQTVTLGLTPEEPETLVTIPLEQALDGVPNLDVLRSRSLGQLSQIEMIFEPGTDLNLSRQLIQERLQISRDAMIQHCLPVSLIAGAGSVTIERACQDDCVRLAKERPEREADARSRIQ